MSAEYRECRISEREIGVLTNLPGCHGLELHGGGCDTHQCEMTLVLKGKMSDQYTWSELRDLVQDVKRSMPWFRHTITETREERLVVTFIIQHLYLDQRRKFHAAKDLGKYFEEYTEDFIRKSL